MGTGAGAFGNQGFQYDPRMIRREISPQRVAEIKAINVEIKRVLCFFRYETHQKFRDEDHHRLNRSLNWTPEERLDYWNRMIAGIKVASLWKQIRYVKPENITPDRDKQKRIYKISTCWDHRRILKDCQAIIETKLTDNFQQYFRNNQEYRDKQPYEKLAFLKDIIFKIQYNASPEKQAMYLKPEHIKRYASLNV